MAGVDAVALEQRHAVGVELDAVDELGLSRAHPAQDAAVLALGVDEHLVDVAGQQVADHPAARGRPRRGPGSAPWRPRPGPRPAPTACRRKRRSRSRSSSVAPAAAVRTMMPTSFCLERFRPARAAARARRRAAAGRRRSPRRAARAPGTGRRGTAPSSPAAPFVPMESLIDLDEHLLAGLEQLVDLALAALLGVGRGRRRRRVQEAVAGQADVDERRLHAAAGRCRSCPCRCCRPASPCRGARSAPRRCGPPRARRREARTGRPRSGWSWKRSK